MSQSTSTTLALHLIGSAISSGNADIGLAVVAERTVER